MASVSGSPAEGSFLEVFLLPSVGGQLRFESIDLLWFAYLSLSVREVGGYFAGKEPPYRGADDNLLHFNCDLE